MFWVPIIFACLSTGECGFLYDTPHVTEKACLKEAAQMGEQVKKNPNIQAWKGTCIPVNPGKPV